MHEEITYINVYGALEVLRLYYGVSHEQPWLRQWNSEAKLSGSEQDGLCTRLQIEVTFSTGQFTMRHQHMKEQEPSNEMLLLLIMFL